jgi:hypothetical protein
MGIQFLQSLLRAKFDLIRADPYIQISSRRNLVKILRIPMSNKFPRNVPSKTLTTGHWKYVRFNPPSDLLLVDVSLRNTTKHAAADDLALRRLMLDEKAQLIEMLRLGVFTKDEFKAELAQIAARYEDVPNADVI